MRKKSRFGVVLLYTLCPLAGFRHTRGENAMGFQKKTSKNVESQSSNTQRVGEKLRSYFSFRRGIDGSFFSFFHIGLMEPAFGHHTSVNEGEWETGLSYFVIFFALFFVRSWSECTTIAIT